MKWHLNWPAVVAVVGLLLGAAGAQERRLPELDLAGQDMRPAVVLARVCAKEAWPFPDGRGYADCPAIAAVLLKIGHGDVVRGARLHSVRVFQPERLRQRPWIAFLQGDTPDVAPRGWPENMNWNVQRGRWRGLLALAHSVLEGPAELPCEPDTWGGVVDRERARRLRYMRIECGPTVNDFYRNPTNWRSGSHRAASVPRGNVPANLAMGAR